MSKKNIIFGIRPVIEAIRSGQQIDKILIKNGLQGDTVRELLALSTKLTIPKQYLPIEGLNKITTKNHQGVIAYTSLIEYQEIENIIPGLFEQGKSPFILILEGVTDVRNFGSICRIAECAGIHAIVVPTTDSAQINSDTIKASSGAIFHVPLYRSGNLFKTLLFLKNSGLKIYAATEKANELYFNCNFSEPFVLVIGSEFKGISKDILKLSDQLIKIPLAGKIESLNVSSAASIIMFEAVKQRILNR